MQRADSPRRGVQASRSLRPLVWGLHVALPLVALWLLIAQPRADVVWEDHASHFVIVMAAAAISFGLALQVRREARRRRDARLLLVAFAFLSAAGFMGLHGLATPNVLLDGRTAGFVLAAPVGLVVAAVFAVWSSIEFDTAQAATVRRAEPVLLTALVAVLVGWSVLSLLPWAPIRQPMTAEAGAAVVPLAVVGVPLYAVAAIRYWRRYRQRPAVVLISIITAFTLLGESLAAVALSRPWALSWWLWHLLMVVGFGFVAYSAHVQYRREGSATTLFSSIALDQTVRQIRAEHREALEELVAVMRRRDGGGASDGAAGGEAGGRAAGAGAGGGAAHRGRAGDGTATRDGGSGPQGAEIAAAAARLSDRFDLTDAQTRILEEAAQATYEVDRLRRQLDALFHLYVSPDVAATLLDRPDRSELGGATVDVTVLFADLRGFTPFAEQHEPADVVDLLNRYFKEAVEVVLAHDGTVVQFIGDEIMALFGAPRPLDDHPAHAARAALALHRRIEAVAAHRPDWPRFRIGVNTGPALVGNVGGRVRSFTAIGDATNLASRLEDLAEPGQVVVGPATWEALGDRADVRPLGATTVKGKTRPVHPGLLLAMREQAHPSAAGPSDGVGPAGRFDEAGPAGRASSDFPSRPRRSGGPP